MSIDNSTTSSIIRKTCTKCGESKSLLEYHHDSRAKDGRVYWCKECVSAYGKVRKAASYDRRCKISKEWPLGLDSHPLYPDVVYREACGFPGYRVGDDGSAWSSRNPNGVGLGHYWRRMDPLPGDGGYIQVGLRRDGKQRLIYLHRLVLLTFVGPCPEGMEARHILNNDPADCRLINLEWGTPIQNAADKIRHGTKLCGSRSPGAKLNEAKVAEMHRLRSEGVTVRKIATRHGISLSYCHMIIKRKAWSHVTSVGTPEVTGDGTAAASSIVVAAD